MQVKKSLYLLRLPTHHTLPWEQTPEHPGEDSLAQQLLWELPHLFPLTPPAQMPDDSLVTCPWLLSPMTFPSAQPGLSPFFFFQLHPHQGLLKTMKSTVTKVGHWVPLIPARAIPHNVPMLPWAPGHLHRAQA